MKRIFKTLTVVAAVVATTGNALAHDWGYRPYYQEPRHERRHHRDDDSDWVGPAIALGIVGLALGAAMSQSSAPPPARVQVPAYVPPPVVAPTPPPVPGDAQYFCRSVGQYYPNTQYCPEGWQQVYPDSW